MRIDTLSPAEGATRATKRLGRGIGSGTGKTSGKGHKGQWARSGGGVRPGFEGGQMPIARRVPKRGFNHVGKIYNTVNVSAFADLPAGTVVDLEFVVANKLTKIRKDHRGNFYPLKVLGNGTLSKALTVKASAFSASAKEAIEKAGGKVEQI